MVLVKRLFEGTRPLNSKCECPGGDDESHMALAASGDLEEHEEAENEDPEEIGQRSATIRTPTATRSRHSEAGK